MFITIKNLKENFEEAVEALKTLREAEQHIAGQIAGETAEDIYSDNTYQARVEQFTKDNSQAIARAICDAASLDEKDARFAVLEKLIEDIEPREVVWSQAQKMGTEGGAIALRGNSDALSDARDVSGYKNSSHLAEL